MPRGEKTKELWRNPEYRERMKEVHKKPRPNRVGVEIRKLQNENHSNWKGDDVSYSGLHKWINRRLGKPTRCSHCGEDGLTGKFINWANIAGEYKRDFSDWVRLCKKCHKAFDTGKISLTI